MMNNRLDPGAGQVDPLAVPEDLATWVGVRGLLNLVLEAGQLTSLPEATRNFVAGDGRSFRPPMLLTLLAFSYARGWLDADSIESMIGTDPTLRYITTGDSLESRDLVRFRRSNREAVQTVLAEVLREAWQQRRASNNLRAGDRSLYLDSSLYRWFDNPLMPDFAKLARRRLDQAVLLDSVAKDL